MEITKPVIKRLARKAGVKSISDETYTYIRSLMLEHLDEIIGDALIINTERNVKTLMVGDIYQALQSRGINITESLSLGTKVVNIE